MGKKEILNTGLWETYSSEVQRRMLNPTHRGEITPEEAAGLKAELVIADWGAESCGDAVRLYWAIDPVRDTILAARFKSFGCGTAIASTDMMAELTIGKSIDEALKITNIEVERALRSDVNVPAVPPQKMHCSVMAYDVIKKAVSIYRKVEMASLDQETIVCECARVSLAMIEDAIRINHLETVEQITQYTKAGGYCKSCIAPGGHEQRKHYLVDIIEKIKTERTIAKTPKSDNMNFATMSIVRKMKYLEKMVQEKIGPVLAGDGGNLEIVDLQEKDGALLLFIEYGGSCKFCPSSRTETLSFIEQTLRDAVGMPITITVLPA